MCKDDLWKKERGLMLVFMILKFEKRVKEA
jgi:hypothetical protein